MQFTVCPTHVEVHQRIDLMTTVFGLILNRVLTAQSLIDLRGHEEAFVILEGFPVDLLDGGRLKR